MHAHQTGNFVLYGCCTYLAHHELESNVVIVIIIIIIIITTTTVITTIILIVIIVVIIIIIIIIVVVVVCYPYYGRCRMLYGFSRDRAVPYWWLWQQVDDHGVPIRAGI